MKVSISSKDGKLVLEVSYDPNICDWQEAINAGLAAYGIQRHQVATVVAIPEDTRPPEQGQTWLVNG
jgi:hypothetical protein